MDIYLYDASYQSSSDSSYSSTQRYSLWIKQDGNTILIKKENDVDGSSRRKYANINEFFDHWGLVSKNCRNIKLIVNDTGTSNSRQ